MDFLINFFRTLDTQHKELTDMLNTAIARTGGVDKDGIVNDMVIENLKSIFGIDKETIEKMEELSLFMRKKTGLLDDKD